MVHRGQPEEDRDRRAHADVDQRLWRRHRRTGRTGRERRRHGDGEAACQQQDRDGLRGVQHRQRQVPAPEAGQARVVHPRGDRRGPGTGCVAHDDLLEGGKGRCRHAASPPACRRRTVARAGSGRSASVRRRGRGERPPGQVEGLGETAPSRRPRRDTRPGGLSGQTRRPRRSPRRSAAGAGRRSAPRGRGRVTPTGPQEVGRAARRRRKLDEGSERPERHAPMDQSHQMCISWCPRGDTLLTHTAR